MSEDGQSSRSTGRAPSSGSHTPDVSRPVVQAGACRLSTKTVRSSASFAWSTWSSTARNNARLKASGSAPASAAWRFGFRDPVAIGHQEIAGPYRHGARLVLRMVEHAEGESVVVRTQALEASVGAAEDGRQMARIDVRQSAVPGIVDRVEQRDEPRRRGMPGNLDVEACDE